jgi:hypothetical protein
VHITVTAGSLVDDSALIVATLVDGADLGELVLVVDEATFRSLAARDIVDGREYLTAAFEMHADGRSRWAPYLVPRDGLAERFGAATLLPRVEEDEFTVRVDRSQEGFLGEAEVIRRLAESESLSLFRPFPDLETVEVLVRHVDNRRFIGLQVKTAGWDPTHLETRVYFRRSSFRAAGTTFVTILSWRRDDSQFAPGCLLIPSRYIAPMARIEGEWMVLELEPGSERHRHLAQYATPLARLGAAVERLIITT